MSNARQDTASPIVLAVLPKDPQFDVNAVLRVARDAFFERELQKAKLYAERAPDKTYQAWKEYDFWKAEIDSAPKDYLIPRGIVRVVIADIASEKCVLVAFYSREIEDVAFACLVSHDGEIVRSDDKDDLRALFLRPLRSDQPNGAIEWGQADPLD